MTLYVLHKGFLEPVQKTFVSDLALKQYKASILGGFQMVIRLGAFPSSLIAVILWDKKALRRLFIFRFV